MLDILYERHTMNIAVYTKKSNRIYPHTLAEPFDLYDITNLAGDLINTIKVPHSMHPFDVRHEVENKGF